MAARFVGDIDIWSVVMCCGGTKGWYTMMYNSSVISEASQKYINQVMNTNMYETEIHNTTQKKTQYKDINI